MDHVTTLFPAPIKTGQDACVQIRDDLATGRTETPILLIFLRSPPIIDHRGSFFFFAKEPEGERNKKRNEKSRKLL